MPKVFFEDRWLPVEYEGLKHICFRCGRAGISGQCTACPVEAVTEVNPAEKGDETAANGDVRHSDAAQLGGHREATVNLTTGDFWPWILVQPRKPRKSSNQNQKSRTPLMAGRGDKAGSRFSALAEEGEHLNLPDENSLNEERNQIVEAWEKGVYNNTSKGSVGPGVGAFKALRQPRRDVNFGPRTAVQKNADLPKASGSRGPDAAKRTSVYRSKSRVSLAEHDTVEPVDREENLSDSIEDDDLMEDNFHSLGLDAAEKGLYVRLRNPPDQTFLGPKIESSVAPTGG